MQVYLYDNPIYSKAPYECISCHKKLSVDDKDWIFEGEAFPYCDRCIYNGFNIYDE